MKGEGNIRLRLIVLSWLQFAIWGSYLTSMGSYLDRVNLGPDIAIFYSVQGIVSLFMPALMGIIADRWVRAERLLSFCHFVSAALMIYLGITGIRLGDDVTFMDLFPAYLAAVGFYMPTIALVNSASYTALKKYGLDTVKSFPSIRLFGTVGFIVSMIIVDLTGLQRTPGQFFVSAAWGIVMMFYALTLPKCPVNKGGQKRSLSEAFGLTAFKLFKKRKMALFFLFSMLLGVSLQITNGYASPFISAFGNIEEYKGMFFVDHANILISLSQLSETLCILLIPFVLRRFGIKTIMLIAMLAWVGRFGFFAIGSPTFPGVLFIILSMIVYGVAFDFFNISGSLFVDNETDASMRSSAQGLFMMMTNGLGATIGMHIARLIVNNYVYSETDPELVMEGWKMCWTIFAGYSMVVTILFALIFKTK
ncbi:MAG: MFS transporter [Bacteroidales bacterium]|nr:MFS transporter [Bacteroidales bacterium]